MKPRGTNNASENELTTPKSAFGKPISQCGLSTKPLKQHELTTPDKTPFQRVDRLLYQQTQRAAFQQKRSTQVTPKISAPKNKSTVETMPILNFHNAS
ncbi:hypothetical protein BBM20_09655 [Vibrio parahaemolyticus]|uniref:hypothetical protein n=1 Tax=Vibrio parahaemolyticus TaxID=670 RepID=UPI00084AB995|nr:hypothetical protein [Vibrio parahaemolyticus]ODY31471.1 hypothetical protein BBM20_09655 [Vibrio parahaemolyticus]WMO02220.1 hypothetical protein NI379_06605 [Vibrio parahaemolyticus]WMO02221.1 hypothetical protein NI379_07250 [Vibrio parahaemolyticus]